DLYPTGRGSPHAVLRDDPARREPRLREGQFQSLVRIDRARAGAAGKSLAMPIYHRLGEIPHKRHSVFRKSDGSLYVEELMGNKGFMGPSSLLYHIYQPTRIKSLRHVKDLVWEADPSPNTQLRHFKTAGLPAGCSAVLDRTPLLFNNDVGALLAQPQAEDDSF